MNKRRAARRRGPAASTTSCVADAGARNAVESQLEEAFGAVELSGAKSPP